MNRYLWADCPTDVWPRIRTINAKSYNDAVEKLIMKYSEELDDDNIVDSIDNWEQLRNYLNDTYSIALSDLEIYEEI